MKILPILSFAITFIILYFFDPKLFETTWKGRSYHLFFLWITSLETILCWEEIEPKIHKLMSIKTIVFVIALLLPTAYIIWANYFGLNGTFVELAGRGGIPFAAWMPISNEYLILMMLFTVIITLEYGVSDLKNYSISILFLGTIGLIFLADNLYPYGRFAPFQIIVPTTTHLAANVLNLMGYKTFISTVPSNILPGNIPYLEIRDAQGNFAGFAIGWPCSGVESLLIYVIVISLFLKKSFISKKQKIIYFLVGAIVTYFINILRIVTIFIIAINKGDVTSFHDYYGQLYSILWITFYPLIIIGSSSLFNKIRKKSLNFHNNVNKGSELP